MSTNELKSFIEDSSVAWEAAGDGIRRKVLGYDDKLMLVVVEFQQGAIGHPHQHPHRQVSYVVNGAFEVEIDGEKQVLRKGDCFYVPGDTMHGAVALEPGTLIDTFAPMRKDFITNGAA